VQRVLVIGSGGAGKSTLARELAARTGLPLVHLDTLYWGPGWTKTPAEEWEGVVRDVIAGERWILDGNFGGTMELRLAAADTAILLDLPRLTCLRRAISRWLRNRGRSRPDLAPGCPESLDLEFLRWIWSYPRSRRPGVLALLDAFERDGGLVVILRSVGDVRAFLESTPARLPAGAASLASGA
jgi:adenylate kinase family enzyme